MKRIILLLTIISHFAFGQSISTKYNSTTKKSYLQTGVVPKADVIEYSDTATGKSPYWKFLTGRIKFKNPIIATDTAGFDGVLVTKGDSLKLVSKSLIGGGSSAAIDTTKQYYIAQGRGSSPFLLYFNGTSWVKNDTSYIPRTGSDNITGNLKRLGSDFKIGLTSNNSFINFGDYSTQITTQGGASTASVQIGSGASSNVSLISGSGSTSFSVSSTSPTRLTGNYIDGDQVYRTDDSLRYIQLKDAQERFAPIGGGAVSSVFGRTGAVVADSGDYDISQITGGLSDTLADGKIWIGDGTNTAFPRTPSGDVTMDNLGVFTVNTINGVTKNYYDPTSSIQTQLNSKQATISLTTTGAIGAASYSNPTINIPKGYDELPTLGVIKSFTGSQWNVTTDWNTTNAGGSFTFGSNKLAMSGTVGTSTYTNYVYISSYISNLDVYSFDEDFTNKSTPSATSYGFSVGIKSFGNQFQTDYSVKVGMTNSDIGTLYIISGGSVVATSNGSVGGTLNDTYNLKISQNKNEITAILTCTSGSVANKSIYVKTTATAGNTYRFVQYQHGGDVDVTRLVYESQQVVGAEYLFEGNSITKGSSPTNINLRYVDMLSKMCKGRFVVHAGNGNVSADALSTVSEVISLAPKYIFILLGTNDAGFLVSTATYDSNITAYVSALTSAGYVVGTNVFFVSILPRNDVSVVAYNNILKADYPTAYIDANTSFASLVDANDISPRYDSGDQLHLNTLGHQDLANLLATQKPSIFVKKDVAEPNMLPLTFTRSASTMYSLPSQIISPEANGTFVGMSRTSTFQPVANLTSNLNYGTLYTTNTGGTYNNYTQLGIVSKINHNSTGTIGQAISSVNEVQINTNGVVSKTIGGYNYVSSNSSAAVSSNAYSQYLGLPKVYSGALTGDTSFLSYAEDASSANSILLLNGGSFSSGTFTKKYGYYAKGGDHSFAGNSKFGIGTNVPVNRLDVEGGAVFGASYSGTNTAPTNGMLVEGSVAIGATTPSAKLHVTSTTAQLRLEYSSSFHTTFTTSSAGNLTVTPNGGNVTLTGAGGSATLLYLSDASNSIGCNMRLQGGGSNPSKYIRANAGNLEVVNNAYNSIIFGIADDGTATLNGGLVFKSYTVATLPTPVTNMMVVVTDALAPTYNATVVGGGAERITVLWNGSAWKCH